MIVYCSEDNGELYLPQDIEVDPETGQAHGYSRYNLDDSFQLTAEQCCGHDGSLVEVLFAAEKLRRP